MRRLTRANTTQAKSFPFVLKVADRYVYALNMLKLATRPTPKGVRGPLSLETQFGAAIRVRTVRIDIHGIAWGSPVARNLEGRDFSVCNQLRRCCHQAPGGTKCHLPDPRHLNRLLNANGSLYLIPNCATLLTFGLSTPLNPAPSRHITSHHASAT